MPIYTPPSSTSPATSAPAPNGTDDTAALNAVFVANTTAQLQAGTYIYTTLTVPAGCHVYGARSWRTTLKCKDGILKGLRQEAITINGDRAGLHDMILDGNRSGFPMGTTTLNGGIDGAVTALTVTSAANFPSGVGYCAKIDNEVVTITAGWGTTSWTVTRGSVGTTAASHSNGATVTYHHLNPESAGLVYIDQVDYVELRDLYIKDAPGTGVYAIVAEHLTIDNCLIEDPYWAGINVNNSSHYARLTNNVVLRPGNGMGLMYYVKGIGVNRGSPGTECESAHISGNFIDIDTSDTALLTGQSVLCIEGWGCPRAVITDNVLIGPSTLPAGTVFGVSIAANSPGATVSNNIMRRYMSIGMEAADNSHGAKFVGNNISDFAIGLSASTQSGARVDDLVISANHFTTAVSSAGVALSGCYGVQLFGECKRGLITGNTFVDTGQAGVIFNGTSIQDCTVSGNIFSIKVQTGTSPRGVQIQSGSGHTIIGNTFGPAVPGSGDGTASALAMEPSIYIVGTGSLIEKCIINGNKMNGRNPNDTGNGGVAIYLTGQVDNVLCTNNEAEHWQTCFAYQDGTLGTNPNVFKNNYFLSTVGTPHYQGLKGADLVERIEEGMNTGMRVTYRSRDDFTRGVVTGTGIGDLGWTVGIGGTSAGTHSYIDSTAGHPGIFQLATAVTASSRNYMHMNVSVSVGLLLATDFFDCLFIIKLTQTDTNTVLRCGLSDATESDPPANGCFIEKVLADTQWFGVTRAASSQTRTAALLTSDTNWNRVRIRRKSATEIGFTINADAEVIATATIPTVSLSPFVMIGNNTGGGAVVKSMQIDAVEFNVLNLAR